MIDAATQKEMITALEWYADNGVDEILLDEVQDRTIVEEIAPVMPVPSALHAPNTPPAQALLGKSDAYDEAIKLAKAANTLEELKAAIAGFDGIAIKKTATNLVFADGNPKAKIMLIGDAPATDEDRTGKPFDGASGELLDKILKCIDLGRGEEKPGDAVYVSNILNWRPPGNRTPSPAEIEVSLPFIERHIQLIGPEIIILCGGVAAKALLGSTLSLSRLRKIWHEYTPQTEGLDAKRSDISAIVTYHPSDLLSNPQQKKSVWSDMLKLQSKHKMP